MTARGSLAAEVSERIAGGMGLACLYARRDGGGHALEAIMAGDGIERITLPVDGGSFESISPAVPCASIYEREVFEEFGLRPEGHPDMRPLRSRSGWGPLEGASAIPGNGISGDGVFEIPVGPIHAGVIGPGHFRFSVAGEPVLAMRAYLGYSRRGVEKAMEGPAGADRAFLAERASGDNSVAHALAYLQTVEQGSEIPLRARYIRTIYAELERACCHLGTISGIATDAALAVPAARGAALRETVLRLNERISGSRMLRGALAVGGVSRDLSAESMWDIENTVMKLEFDVLDLFKVIAKSPSFMDRAESTGRLSCEDAEALRAVGPVARASGSGYDVRKRRPYAAYGDIALNVPSCRGGDVYARLSIRKEEAMESLSAVTQCLNQMREGPVRARVETEDGFHVGVVESPRGEALHCAHISGGVVTRYKIRDASFPNWPALERAVMGNIVPDFPLVNKSFDLSYSGNDL
ncbi:MAG: NADH-quinone oxidoreductase subunit C [Candidatus Methanoplasma sp.]|nr:NADH-quinone oxidoreductase subunit C [Candidatus Methanoplasma sp.]